MIFGVDEKARLLTKKRDRKKETAKERLSSVLKTLFEKIILELKILSTDVGTDNETTVYTFIKIRFVCINQSSVHYSALGCLIPLTSINNFAQLFLETRAHFQSYMYIPSLILHCLIVFSHIYPALLRFCHTQCRYIVHSLSCNLYTFAHNSQVCQGRHWVDLLPKAKLLL